MLPVLVANWTSTASLVDQYWFIFPSLLLVWSTSLTAWYGLLYVWALFDRDSRCIVLDLKGGSLKQESWIYTAGELGQKEKNV